MLGQSMHAEVGTAVQIWVNEGSKRMYVICEVVSHVCDLFTVVDSLWLCE